MTEEPHSTSTRTSGLIGVVRLVAAVTILLVASLAVLLVLDVISADMFGTFATKVVLVSCIVGLASIAIAILSLSRK